MSPNQLDMAKPGAHGREPRTTKNTYLPFNGKKATRPCSSTSADGAHIDEKMGHEFSYAAEGTKKDKNSTRRFPRISLPFELMRDSYDVVVIGTGYGGGVAASRMARGKQSVCVLERGKEKWPGEYPESLLESTKEVRLSGEFAPGDRRGIPGKLIDKGNPTGMLHFALGDGQNVYMGNGLGGTSLVNANVFLEATPAVLEMEVWPEELRGAEKWEKYYQRAAEVLEPVPYPESSPELLKAKLLQKQASLLGLQDNFYRVRQTTRFEDGPNSTGVPMRASKLTGMDATGINDGSKSSTLVNYLSDAWNWGAEMFCECEVRYVAKAPGREGYIVYFAWHGGRRSQYNKSFYEDLMWVHAKKFVFFGAGSLGTTEILLRSKQFGLDISDDLGTEMSGNGDMLGFGYNTDYEANCVASPVPSPERPVGPCITSVLDMRGQKNPLEGFVVEDCAIPAALSKLMFPILEFPPDPNRPVYNFTRGAAKLASRVASKLFGAHFAAGSVFRTATYLVMSHDSSQGRLLLKKDQPVLTYSGVGRSASVSRVHEFLEKLTEVVGGNFIANPAWTLLGAQQITVHPIGGARMSSDGTGACGVTSHIGEIFKDNTSSDVYDGLVVCDGSVVPAAVGVNPFATITALAERSVELVAQKHGIQVDYETKNGLLDLFGKPAHSLPRDESEHDLATMIATSNENNKPSMEFSEVMTGFIYSGADVKDFDTATKYAKTRSESARFFLTAKTWDLMEFINGTEHAANLTGTFSWAALGGSYLVQRGTFRLFNEDPRQPETTNLVYSFRMVSPSGRILYFDGYKVINSGAFLSPRRVWDQTSTLYATITDPDVGVLGRGTLNIQTSDFLKELQTFHPSGPTPWARFASAAGYLKYFTKNLCNPFFSTLGHLQWPETNPDALPNSPTPSHSIPLEAIDGVKTNMLLWNPVSVDGNEDLSPAPVILFVPGSAVNHTIYALPTIEKNTISYFREAGYRSYCVTHRTGITPVAKEGWTPYDMRLDILAALTQIRELESARHGGTPPQVYVVAHCVGSIAFSCGLLDGSIPAAWIKAITVSQVFMTPRFGKMPQITSGIPMDVYIKLFGHWWDCRSSRDDTAIQQLMNQALRFYPVVTARETCRSVVCHRSELVFGRLWNHVNLNEATHRQLEHFLGGVSMKTIGWLTQAGRQGYVMNNEARSTSLLTPEGLDRLKGIPILFLSGSDNMVFTPENTDTSFTTLCNAHGRRWYEREVFPGVGHLDTWMGASAYKTVYPRVRRHIDEHMKGI